MTRLTCIARLIQKYHSFVLLTVFGTLSYVFGFILLLTRTTNIAFPAFLAHASYGIAVLFSPFALLCTLYIIVCVWARHTTS